VYNEKQNELDFINIRELDGSLSSIDSALLLHDTTTHRSGVHHPGVDIVDDPDETIQDNEQDDDNDFSNHTHVNSLETMRQVKRDSFDDDGESRQEVPVAKNNSINQKNKPVKTLPAAVGPLPPLKSETPTALLGGEDKHRHRVSFKVNGSGLTLKQVKPFRMTPVDEPEDDEEEMRLRVGDNWLLRWCIIREARSKQCQKAFDAYDVNGAGLLTLNQLMGAIGSFIKLNNFKKNYLISVLNLCEIRTNGVDLNLFNILAALAHRVSQLDDKWFRNILPQLDLSTIENKMFKVRNLWSYLADKRTRTVNIPELLVEFEAGGVTREHVEYAREKFGDKESFDLLDYLTYIPLFVHIHDRIVLNPFDKQRDI
jgi:hypothetical protein